MILVCGIPSEGPIEAVVEACEAEDRPVLMFNQRHAGSIEVIMEVGGRAPSGSISIAGQRHALDSITAVYLRVMDYRDLPEYKAAAARHSEREVAARIRLAHQALTDFCELTEALVVNRGAATASNGSKPFQAQLIRRVGFSVPDTLVTNDAAEVREFLASRGRVIFKSASSLRSIVYELDEKAVGRMDRLRLLPTQFQAYVPGTNIRVHVVGTDIHATEIESEAIDYRYSGRQGLSTEMQPHVLPDAIAQRCLDLSVALELPLCGIDLKRTPSGEYFCFEVNPSPAFSYYEGHTGQPIAASIARLLASGKSRSVAR